MHSALSLLGARDLPRDIRTEDSLRSCGRLQLASNRALVHEFWHGFKIVYLVGSEMSAAAQQQVNQVDHNASWRVAAAELMGLAEDDFSCPICMSMIRDPFVTDCGHTFCFQCISMHLVNKKSCPCCSTYVTADKIHPNFLLHKVIHKVSQANLGAKADPSERVVQLLTADNSRFKLGEVNKLLQVLWERKLCLEQQDAESNLQLLLHFLRHSKQQKSRQLIDLQSELQLLESDIKQVASRQLDSKDASQHGQAHQQLPSRQPSTQLLQKRLQEAMSTVSVAAKQSAESSKASEAEGQSRPSLPAQSAPAVHGWHSCQPRQQQLSVRSMHQDSQASFLLSLHFHQQQAALQQRQQPTGQGLGGAGSGAAAASGGPLGDPPCQAATQEAAVRSRRRRVLSQFDDLQQCYLRLRKAGKTAAPHLVPAGPSKHATQCPAAEDEPSVKRIKHEQPSQAQAQAHAEPPADSTAGPDPLSSGGAAEVTPADTPSSSVHPQVNGISKADSREPEGMEAAEARETEAAETLVAQKGSVTGPADEEGLAEFSRMLSVFTHCGRLKVIAQLLRPSNQHSSSILSSIEFDRDSEVFATAGVSKRISLYEYSAIMANPAAETHCPSQELVTRSKLSCLSWNKYLKTYLASSDYEGVVHTWDIATGQNVAEYEAHEKRIWSVDFCHTDPMLLMSGSDDGMIWSTNQANSVAEIDIKANVCCAKYNPESMYEIAVGAADHTVLTYDLRKSDKAVHTYKGHRKAVSYVRYLNGRELVSASTDSTLRLWDTKACTASRVFNGHNNEKNFVGMSVDNDFIACGSETNEVYVYYKAMTKPVCCRFFSTAAEVASNSHNQDPSQFISAVCWKPHSQILLSANSQGTIKLMQLTS
ncbi:MAG: ubiquitin ligase COP1 [Trebouxia sp. A1-2]|nr:MAG: ubiquitin ligase COP1 [Trebouxia sp. A1-2]